MIHFSFAYVGSDGNEHIGPSNSNTAGTIFADVYNLNGVSADNSAQPRYITDRLILMADGIMYINSIIR